MPTSTVKAFRLPPLPTIKDIIRLYNLKAMRQLSQNFLLDQNLTEKIVRCCGYIEGAEVCEVGPGPGNITRSIINQMPSKIILIEKDKRFFPSLQMLGETIPIPLRIIHGDVLNFNMEKMFSKDKCKDWQDEIPNIRLIGNLPFNISTPLIIRWLEAISERKNAWSYGRVPMVLTFQKEVAERMTSPVMTSQRCRLSVMCQNWCKVHHKFTIPGAAFLPKPDVDVGVVQLTPLINPVIPLPFKMIEKFVRSLFQFRQKYAYKGVGTLFPSKVRDEFSGRIFKQAEIEPTVRPFQLTIPEIGRLCAAYKTIIDEQPLYESYDQFKLNDEENWLAKEEIEKERIEEWRKQQNRPDELQFIT